MQVAIDFINSFRYYFDPQPDLVPRAVDKKIQQSALLAPQAKVVPSVAEPELRTKQIQIEPQISVALKNAVQVYVGSKIGHQEIIDPLHEDDKSESAQSAPGASIGIPNIGNSCYMNATLQALCSCPRILEMLGNSSEAIKINSFREPVVAFMQELQKKEKVISKERASGLMDFLMSNGWSSEEKKLHPHDAYPFFQFLMSSLGLDHKMHGVDIGNEDGAIQLHDLLFPDNLSARVKKKLFLNKNKKCDFLIVALESRFLDQEGRKNTRRVQLPRTVDLPYVDNEKNKEHYKLAAVIVNPSSFGNSGHYITYVPQGDKWVEYNDSKVLVHDTLDPEVLDAIEQHSYLYLYTYL